MPFYTHPNTKGKGKTTARCRRPLKATKCLLNFMRAWRWREFGLGYQKGWGMGLGMGRTGSSADVRWLLATALGNRIRATASLQNCC